MALPRWETRGGWHPVGVRVDSSNRVGNRAGEEVGSVRLHEEKGCVEGPASRGEGIPRIV